MTAQPDDPRFSHNRAPPTGVCLLVERRCPTMRQRVLLHLGDLDADVHRLAIPIDTELGEWMRCIHQRSEDAQGHIARVTFTFG